MAARKDLGAYLASRGIDVQTATQEPPEQAVSQQAAAAPRQAPARQAPRQAPQPTTSQFTTPEEYLQHRAQIKLGAQKPVQPNPVAPVQAPVQPQVAQGTELSAQISQATPQAAPQVSKPAVSPPAPAAAPPSTGVVPSPQPATERTTPGAGGIPTLGLRTAFEAGRNVGNLSMEVLPAGPSKLFGDESPLTRGGRVMNNVMDWMALKGKRVAISGLEAGAKIAGAPLTNAERLTRPDQFIPWLAEKAMKTGLKLRGEAVRDTKLFRALNALSAMDDVMGVASRVAPDSMMTLPARATEEGRQMRSDAAEWIRNLDTQEWEEQLRERDDKGWLYKDQPWNSPANIAENALSIVDTSLNKALDQAGLLATVAATRSVGALAGPAMGYMVMSAMEGSDFLRTAKELGFPARFAEPYAADYGAISGSVEYIQNMQYLGHLLKGAKNPAIAAAGEAWDSIKDTPLGKVLRNKIVQYASEGGEEVIQSLTGYNIAQKMAADYEAQTGIKIEIPEPDLWEDFLTGAVIGGVLDVGGTLVERATRSEGGEQADEAAQPALTSENLVPGTPDAERETQIPGQAVLRGAQEGPREAQEDRENERTGQRQGEVRVGGENAVTGLVDNEVPAAETVAETPQEQGTPESVNENLPGRVVGQAVVPTQNALDTKESYQQAASDLKALPDDAEIWVFRGVGPETGQHKGKASGLYVAADAATASEFGGMFGTDRKLQAIRVRKSSVASSPEKQSQGIQDPIEALVLNDAVIDPSEVLETKDIPIEGKRGSDIKRMDISAELARTDVLPDQVTPETIGSLIPRDENGNPASQQVGIEFTDRLAERFEGDPAELRRMADEVDQRIQRVSRDPEATTDQIVQAQREQLEAQIYREVAQKVEEAGAQAEAPAEQAQAEQPESTEPIFTEDEIRVTKPFTQTRKRQNGTDGTVSVSVSAPEKVVDPEAWDRLGDRSRLDVTVEARIDFKTGAKPKRADPVWSIFSNTGDLVASGLTYKDALQQAKTYVMGANPQAEQQAQQAAPEQSEAAEPETPRRTRITKRGKEQGQGGFFSVPSFLRRTPAAAGGVRAPVPPTDRQVQQKAKEITSWIRRNVLPGRDVPKEAFMTVMKYRRDKAAGKLGSRREMATIEKDVIEPLEDITNSDRIAEAASWYMRGAMTEQEFRASFGTAGKTLTPGSKVDIVIGGEDFGTMKIDQNGNIVVQTGPNKLDTYTPAELDAKIDQFIDTLRGIHDSNVARQQLFSQWEGLSEEMRERIEENDYYQTLMYERWTLGSRYRADPQAYQDAINLAQLGFEGAIEGLARRAGNLRAKSTTPGLPQMDITGFMKTGDESLLTGFTDDQKATARQLRDDYRRMEGLILDIYTDPNTGEVKAQEQTQELLDAAQDVVDYYMTRKKGRGGAQHNPNFVHLTERTLNEIWRKLYIEIDDPGPRQAKTAEVQTSLLAETALWNALWDMGEGEVWSANPRPSKGLVVQLGSSNAQYGRMSGMYVSKGLAELIGTGPSGMNRQVSKFADLMWFKPMATQRLGKLLWFPQVGRNYQTAYFGFALQVGDPGRKGFHKYFAEAHKIMKGYAQKKPDAIARVEEMARLGVFRHDLQQVTYDLDQALGGTRTDWYGQLMRNGGAAYAFVDFPTKYASYMANRDKNVRDGMSAEEASKAAVEHVLLHYQNRDRVPEIFSKLSKTWVGDYLAYPYDSGRASINAMKYAARSLKKGDYVPALGFIASRWFYALAFAWFRDEWTDKVRRTFRALRHARKERNVQFAEILSGDRERGFRGLQQAYYEKAALGVWKEIEADGTKVYRSVIYSRNFAQSLEDDALGAAIASDSLADFGKNMFATLAEQYGPGMHAETLTRWSTGKELSNPTDRVGVLELLGAEHPDASGVFYERTRRAILDIFGGQLATPIRRTMELAKKEAVGQEGDAAYYYDLDSFLDIWMHSVALVRTYKYTQENMDRMVIGKIREKAISNRQAKAMVKSMYAEEAEQGSVRRAVVKDADIGQRKRLKYLRDIREVMDNAQAFDSEWYSTKRLREILSDRDNGLSLSTDEIDALVRNRLDRIRPHVPQGYK